jgi:hypothetical protein
MPKHSDTGSKHAYNFLQNAAANYALFVQAFMANTVTTVVLQLLLPTSRTLCLFYFSKSQVVAEGKEI